MKFSFEKAQFTTVQHAVEVETDTIVRKKKK